MEELSPRQTELLEFLRGYHDQNGVVPSYREIGVALGIQSTNAVSDHIKALQRKGYIERVGDPGRPRSLRLTTKAVGIMTDDAVARKCWMFCSTWFHTALVLWYSNLSPRSSMLNAISTVRK